MEDKIKYLIALSQLKGVGFRRAHQIVEEFGSAREFLEEAMRKPEKIPSVIRENCTRTKIEEALEYADSQISYCEKYRVKILAHGDADYPERLTRYPDSPLILYFRGEIDLNAKKTLAMVGTRKMTAYGKWMIEEFIREMAGREVMIISGLAYGVDTQVHRSCVEYGVPTIGVMGTGIDLIYPSANRNLAKKMIEKGGVLTEYGTGTQPDAYNFPARNRIIAALSDGLIVVESKDRGGAMITADLAFGYEKEVFAFPGRARDPYSRGTNLLVKSHKAQMIESATDFLEMMGWDASPQKEVYQRSLFDHLTEEEQRVIEAFREERIFHVDQVLNRFRLSNSQTASILLQMELKGVLRSLPGNKYMIV